MPFDRQIKRADFEYLYSDKIVCCKWLDRRSVAMLFSNAEGMATTSTVPLQQKGSASKNTCPSVITMYNKGMGGVSLIDQSTTAYHLDRKSTIRFYLRIFFDLMDVAYANSDIVYKLATYVKCTEQGIFLCLIKERKCFKKHHS